MSTSDLTPDIPRIVSLSTDKVEDKTKRNFTTYIAQAMSSNNDIALQERVPLTSDPSETPNIPQESSETTLPQQPLKTTSLTQKLSENAHVPQLSPDSLKEVNHAIIKRKKCCNRPKLIIVSVVIIFIILVIVTFAVLIWQTFKEIEHLKESSYPNVPIVDGNWSEWGDWSQCSATCGHGLRSRTRTCSDPEPSIGGKNCLGQNVEYRMCNFTTCTGDIAAFSWKFKIQNGDLTFLQNDKIYEHGNGFTSATRIFTCSIPGIYLFSVTLVKEESNSNLTCHLYKTEPYPSSKQLISLILNSSNFSSNSLSYASATVLVDLKVNDTMYLSGCYASSSSSKAYSVFSGVLLHKTI